MKHLLLLFSFMAAVAVNAQEKQFSIYFDFDADTLNTAQAGKFAKWADDNKEASITKLEGYADSTGVDIYNVDLSGRRLGHITKRLVMMDNDKMKNLAIQAFGESMSQTGPNAKNRRVTIYYTLPEPPKPAETEFTKAVDAAKKGDRLRLPNMNFYNNSDIMLPESRPILEELLSILRSRPGLRIEIQGHICCQVVEENQIALKRAVAVYKYLIDNGIDKSRLSYKSFGSSRPIHKLPEKTEAEKVANRRVEIEILDN